jgi:arylsulfatase A-like enzyme
MNVVFCNPASGLDRGFESYDFRTTDASNRGHRNAAATTDAALQWTSQVADRPFFLLVHYFDAHLTYDPPEPFDAMFLDPGVAPIPRGFGSAQQVMALRDGSIPMSDDRRNALVARYDGELRFLDQEFGRLRSGLEALGRWDDSLIIVVGDHGEEFWDHGGFEHGHSHHRELLRVPLIVRKPGDQPGAHRAELVRQVDIVPTVLEHLGLEPNEDLPGQVLGSGQADRTIAEGSLWGGDLVSVRTAAGTLILNRDTGEIRLFGPDDPMENTELQQDPDGLGEILGALLPAESGDHDDPTIWTPDPEEMERLRSLGYVQ